MKTLRSVVAIAACASALVASIASAEVTEIRTARQYGIAYAPLMVMQDQKLIEKHAKALGLGEVKVSWNQFVGGAVMNDALLAGGLDFAVAGPPPFLTLWARTHGTAQEVLGLASLNSMPMYLVTRNPNVRSIRDFTDKDRIVVSGVKVSTQAVVLQMAAAKEFGVDKYDALDRLTVAMPLSDSMAIMLSGKGEVTADFTVPPFSYRELKTPGMHSVLDTFGVTGGPSSTNVIYTTARFAKANPKIVKAYLDALAEAQAWIVHNRRAAAETYLRISKDRETVDDVVAMLSDPKVEYALAPRGLMQFADFMSKVGTIKVKPSSWKDLFLPAVYDQPGS